MLKPMNGAFAFGNICAGNRKEGMEVSTQEVEGGNVATTGVAAHKMATWALGKEATQL